MERLYKYFDSLGPAWDITVIVIAIIAFMVWMDVFVGNRVYSRSTTIIGSLFGMFIRFYSLRRNKVKAIILHWIRRKRYHVVIIGSKYYVINRYQVKRINKLIKKYKEKITIYELLTHSLYHTK